MKYARPSLFLCFFLIVNFWLDILFLNSETYLFRPETFRGKSGHSILCNHLNLTNQCLQKNKTLQTSTIKIALSLFKEKTEEVLLQYLSFNTKRNYVYVILCTGKETQEEQHRPGQFLYGESCQ